MLEVPKQFFLILNSKRNEQSGKPLPNRIRNFEIPLIARCQYVNREIKVYDYKNREPKTACFDYVLLTHISEIKNNLGIDTSIVPKIFGYNMQKHEDRHQLWTHDLAIYGSSKFAFSMTPQDLDQMSRHYQKYLF